MIVRQYLCRGTYIYIEVGGSVLEPSSSVLRAGKQGMFGLWTMVLDVESTVNDPNKLPRRPKNACL